MVLGGTREGKGRGTRLAQIKSWGARQEYR